MPTSLINTLTSVECMDDTGASRDEIELVLNSMGEEHDIEEHNYDINQDNANLESDSHSD
jgi:hypothetical protein